jgi:hypothetical protein
MSTDRYVSFESLVLTDRVVRLSGHRLKISFAGDNPVRGWVTFHDKKTAKRAGGSLILHVREKIAAGECRTDHNYNTIVSNWIDQLSDGGYLVKRDQKEEEVEGDVNG